MRALGLRGLRALEGAIVPAEREAPARSRPIVYFDEPRHAGQFSVRKALGGKRVLLIGVTGFIGKVWLANTLLEETGTRSDETVIIGDSSIDVITGRNAELWTCGVTYGFAPRTLDDAPPDVLIDTPGELAEVFG